jgi:hypothetical protein
VEEAMVALHYLTEIDEVVNTIKDEPPLSIIHKELYKKSKIPTLSLT